MKLRLRYVLLALLLVGTYVSMFKLLMPPRGPPKRHLGDESRYGTDDESTSHPAIKAHDNAGAHNSHVEVEDSTPETKRQMPPTTVTPVDGARPGSVGVIVKQFHAQQVARQRAEALIKQGGDTRPPKAGDDTLNLPDLQLFVIWGGAMSKAESILRGIASKFVVLGVSMFHWEKADTQENLWRLYSGKGGWDRKGMALKVKQCGPGNFVALVVADPKPVYRTEKTAHGDDVVSSHVHEAKTKYRAMSGGGFKVHGTYNPQEADHDIALLFGRSKDSFVEAVASNRDFDPTALTDDFMTFLKKHKLLHREHRHLALDDPAAAEAGHFYTTNSTFGFRGFQSCAQMLFAVNTVPHVHFYQGHRGEHGNTEYKHLGESACSSWPDEVTMAVPARDVWAAVAALNGTPEDDSRGKAGAKRPPHIFSVKFLDSRRLRVYVKSVTDSDVGRDGLLKHAT